MPKVQVATVLPPTFKLTLSLPAVPRALTDMELLPVPLVVLVDVALVVVVLVEVALVVVGLPPPVAPGMSNQFIWPFAALTLTYTVCVPVGTG